MNASLRSLGVCLTCCIAGLTLAPACALAEGASSLGGSGASPFGSALVVPGSPAEGEQLEAQEEARRSGPEAVVAREASATAYEGLSTEQAGKLAGEVFPVVVGEPDGGPPALPDGVKATGFPSDFAMSLALPEGKLGVVDSLAAIAVDTPSGRVPVDLGLREVGSGYEAKTPAAGVLVRIPKHLGEGVVLSDSGVSLTPVDEHGSVLEGVGVVDGASVFYGDSENANAGVYDTDTLA